MTYTSNKNNLLNSNLHTRNWLHRVSVSLTQACCSVVQYPSWCVASVAMSVQLSDEDNSPPPILHHRLYLSPRTMCLTRKPVIVILLWVFVIGSVSKGIQYSGTLGITFLQDGHGDYRPLNYSFIYMVCFYALMALIATTYPIGGFLADVYLGRYKMVTTSLAFIWMALLLLGIALIISVLIDHITTAEKNLLKVIRDVFLGLVFLTIIPGLAGFYSNMTQLSLDQLQDAPSYTLGIFLHWCVWVDLLGESLASIVYTLLSAGCLTHNKISDVIKNTGYVMTSVVFVLLSILLVLNCFTKRWFYTADIRYNPYRTVVDVLKYVRTHKYPTRHSALHWTNGERPSRFDFAKECYGGPFTSPQVEDVKTLGRVVLVLLAVGPVFALCVPTSYLIFLIFSFHVMGRSETRCSPEWIFIKSGTLSYLVGLGSLPVIAWVVYSVLRNRVPKILTRMEIGIVLYILCVLSMLIIDVIGHSVTRDTTNITHCLFLESYKISDSDPYYHFNFPWYVLIIPNCFSVISYSLILVTLLEFISAQAPQPMKGLVFGVFFAIKGIVIFIAASFLVPFSLLSTTTILSPYVSCGTSYFFLTLVMSLVGLFLFACVSRRYKYRRRDEEPFSQAVVEEIFERRLQHNAEESPLQSPTVAPGCGEARDSASVRRPVRVSESEEVRASEWFVAVGERQSRGEPERLLSLSHNWYGTFQYDDSERGTH